ncbi:MAG: winged helix-turn-helix transcriptional regulator [Nitrososphaera sp.]
MVKTAKQVICLCPLEGVIDIISKKWALLIVNEIGNHGRIRYNDLMKEIQAISPKTLADTLKELARYGLINREAFNEIPPRVDYTLTKDGEELRQAIVPVLKWALSRKGTVVAHCSCSMIEKGKRIDRSDFD